MKQRNAHAAETAGPGKPASPKSGYPQRLGPFVVAASIEESGVGEAYLAVPEERGHRPCRLRHLRLSGRQAPELVSVFRGAGEVARRLHHPAVEETLAVGQVDDDLFVAQAFRPGTVLSRLPTQLLSVPAAVYVARRIALALAYLHGFSGRGLVHHRVAPASIYLGLGGEVKLLDCSLARAAQGQTAPPRALRMASRYVAPEVQAGESGDGRSDIYALGVVLWELLTGRTFGRPDGSRHVPLPSRFNRAVPAGLDICVARAIDPEPKKRFAKMADLAAALRRFSAGRWAGQRRVKKALASLPVLEADRRALDAKLEAARRLAGGSHRRRRARGAHNWRLGMGWASPVVLIAGAAAFAAWSKTHPTPPLAAQKPSPTAESFLGAGSPAALPANPVPSPRETPAAHSAGGAAGAAPDRGGLSLGQGPKGPGVSHSFPVQQGRSLPRRRPPGRLDAEARARGFALLQTAEGRFQWGDLEGAERFTREALEALPKEPRARYFLGLLLMARGQPEAAATAFEKTLALDKDHTDARSKLRMAKEHASFRKKVDYDTVAP